MAPGMGTVGKLDGCTRGKRPGEDLAGPVAARAETPSDSTVPESH